MYQNIKTIAFDADDTLWVNEPYFRAVEERFCELMGGFMPAYDVSKELLTTEIQNIRHYGYGVKGFMLSMLETALRISGGHVHSHILNEIIDLGKEMFDHPIELLPHVKEVLTALQGKYRLVVATKGDLLDQARKLQKSGLEAYFHHIEIMSEKKEQDYTKLIRHLDLDPSAFLMIGNSLKSDVIPVLNLGGYACHIPFHIIWALETVSSFDFEHPRFKALTDLNQVLDLLPL